MEPGRPWRELLLGFGCVVAGALLLGLAFAGVVPFAAQAVILVAVALTLRGLFELVRIDGWLAVGVSLMLVFGAIGTLAAKNASRTEYAAWERPDTRDQASLATRARVFLWLATLSGALAADRTRRTLRDGSSLR